jgi:hypothetical protein
MNYPDHFTQPEPINHNELRRLLMECFDVVIDEMELYGSSMFGSFGAATRKEKIKDRISHTIHDIVLNGDDS